MSGNMPRRTAIARAIRIRLMDEISMACIVVSSLPALGCYYVPLRRRSALA